jgi:hypothetical protein
MVVLRLLASAGHVRLPAWRLPKHSCGFLDHLTSTEPGFRQPAGGYDWTMNVTVADLRALLASTDDEPTLILVGGRFETVPAAELASYPGALEVTSRTALRLELAREDEPTDEELETRAAILSTGITELGA